MELNKTHQLLIYDNDVNYFGWKYKYHKEKHRSSVRGQEGG
jgi:hypothetical protein